MPKQLFIFILLLFVLVSCQRNGKNEHTAVVLKTAKDTLVAKEQEVCIHPKPIDFLGIDVDSFCVKEKELGKRDNLQKLFTTLKLNKYQYAQFIEDTKEYVDFSNLAAKQKYFTITKETDHTTALQYIVFKLSEYEYIIANCTDTNAIEYHKAKEWPASESNKKRVALLKRKHHLANRQKPIYFCPLQVSLYEKKIDTTEIKFAAVIKKSVAKTFKEHHLDTKLIEQLNKAYNGKYNINSLRKGDTLQFIYQQLSINGRFLDYGHVEAICCKTKKKPIYAVDYFIEEDSSFQYADEKGHYLKTAFLKSPLQKGGNIVSRYNLHRFHPVLQVEKAHLGTDFAAPQGAPIIATASGVVTAAQFTQNNGNYVKIRHDRMYETQYLHMVRFARGIRNGARVQQGQVIGYVGSTGLATGPHVCYRFWKHGAQVDPLREKLNVIKQISTQELQSFLKHFTNAKSIMNKIPIV